MNIQRLASALMGILFGSTCIFSAAFANTQLQTETKTKEAYRYNLTLQFVVANRILFGKAAYKNILWLYAYEPSSLEGLDILKTSDVKILKPKKPKKSKWWLEPSYEVMEYEGDDLSGLSEEKAYLAVEEDAYLALKKAAENAENIEYSEYSDLFIVEQEDDQTSANAADDEGNTTIGP